MWFRAWWGEVADRLADISPATVQKQVGEFLATRLNVLIHVRDAMDESQGQQKQQADAKNRGCIESYKFGDQVLLHAKNLPTNVVSAVFKTKLRARFIGPFTITDKKGLAYALNIPRKLCTHPVFYVDLLKPYRDPSHVNLEALAPMTRAVPRIAVSESASPTDPPSEFEHTPLPSRLLITSSMHWVLPKVSWRPFSSRTNFSWSATGTPATPDAA